MLPAASGGEKRERGTNHPLSKKDASRSAGGGEVELTGRGEGSEKGGGANIEHTTAE